MGKTLWDVLVAAGEAVIDRTTFGQKMHDPNVTEDEKQEIIKQVIDAGGYENLPEDC